MSDPPNGSPEWETIRLEHEEGGIGLLVLARPAKRNAMSPRMNEEVAAALEVLRYDEAVRVVVLTGAGEAFCGGMGIKEFLVGLKDRPDEYDRIERLTYEWRARTPRRFPKPVIAMVNGWTFGGVSLVESCDLAVAAEEATFGVSEINFGLFHAGPVARFLTRLARSRDGLLHAMTGRPFDGRLEPDNNPVERAIRPLALGRKNWLFAGSNTGGQRAATARLNEHDPEAYPRDALGRVADHPVVRVADLLPWNLGVSTNPN